MAPDSDRDTLAERLITVPRVIFRWATPPPRPDGSRSGSGLGCLNPLMLVKILVGLLVIVLMPLYLLPAMLMRIATVGRASVRFSSVIDVTSGEPARWGYGTLQPPADPASVHAGAAAIAAHDPEFDAVKLMNWAAAVTALICQSLTSADATPARTFMANGLFRTYLSLLELRARAKVSCAASWRATGATLVEAVSTPLFDEVRVRLSCQGWCWERHEETGLTLRGSPDQRAWSEDLTFGRSADALSPAAGGLPAQHCPSCGAQLDLDPDGSCRYCHGIVTAGRHDWVLIGWRREPW